MSAKKINKILTLPTQFFMNEEFNFGSIKNKAIELLKAGKPLLGRDEPVAYMIFSSLVSMV